MDQHCASSSLPLVGEGLYEFVTPCERKDCKKVARNPHRLGNATDRFHLTWLAQETASRLKLGRSKPYQGLAVPLAREDRRLFIAAVVLLSLINIAESQISCRKGWYATSSDCKRCPPGYSTLSANSTSVSNCTICDAASALNEEGKCDNLERKELIEFHESTNGDGWSNKWNISEENTHHCDWYRVECDDESRVRVIDLNNNELRGTITSFEQLTNLRVLDFGCNREYDNPNRNRLTGTMPNYEKNIHLEKLDLSCNQLGGTITSFEQLTNLFDLQLNNNELTGECYCFEVSG